MSGDYLMDETNKNFMREDMDYLGIGAKNIAKAGLSFNVRPFNIGNLLSIRLSRSIWYM